MKYKVFLFITKRKVCHTQSTLCLICFLSKIGPSFHIHQQMAFPLPIFFPTLILVTVYAVLIFWLSSHSFQRERRGSWLRLLSLALSGWVAGVAASVLSCVAGGELGVHSYFTWETSGLSAFFGNNCFCLKSRTQKSNNWKLSTFRLLWHQVSFELFGGKRREILFEKG